jgi:hypothetical protein
MIARQAAAVNRVRLVEEAQVEAGEPFASEDVHPSKGMKSEGAHSSLRGNVANVRAPRLEHGDIRAALARGTDFHR